MGIYWWSYFGMMTCNVLSPQFFWSRKLRRNVTFTFFMSILINIGMWFERFVIIATTLARDYLPSSWSYYSPTWVEIGIFLGTLGIFFTFYLLFVRIAPVVAIAEIKHILKTAGDQYVGENASHSHVSASHSSMLHSDDNDATADAKYDFAADFDNDGDVDLDDEAIKSNLISDMIDGDDFEIVDLDLARNFGFEPKFDDLKIVEGIGPKIEAILKAGGIGNWISLAAAKAEYMKDLMMNEGEHYQIHDPGTWADQAQMAVEGKWEALKEWQDELHGGQIK